MQLQLQLGLVLAALALVATSLAAGKDVQIRCVGGQPLIQCGPAEVSDDNDAKCAACCSGWVSTFTHYAKGNWGLTSRQFGLQCCCGIKTSGAEYREREPYFLFSQSSIADYENPAEEA